MLLPMPQKPVDSWRPAHHLFLVKLSFLQPRGELRGHIQSIWLFESDSGLPASDVSMAAPNGCPKLVVNFENSLISSVHGRAKETTEQSLSFVGIRSLPVVLSTPPRRTSFLGIEFRPSAVFPIFGIPMNELTNRLVPAASISSLFNGSFADQVWNQRGIPAKVDVVQHLLVEALGRGQSRNRLIEYCVEYLRRTNGAEPISALEDKTGYGRRALEVLFKKHVGVSPKALAGIFRFQWFYRNFARERSYESVKEHVYEMFYDQSHFTNEFRKMTGFSPRSYSRNIRNEFGRRVTLSHG